MNRKTKSKTVLREAAARVIQKHWFARNANGEAATNMISLDRIPAHRAVKLNGKYYDAKTLKNMILESQIPHPEYGIMPPVVPHTRRPLTTEDKNVIMARYLLRTHRNAGPLIEPSSFYRSHISNRLFEEMRRVLVWSAQPSHLNKLKVLEQTVPPFEVRTKDLWTQNSPWYRNLVKLMSTLPGAGLRRGKFDPKRWESSFRRSPLFFIEEYHDSALCVYVDYDPFGLIFDLIYKNVINGTPYKKIMPSMSEQFLRERHEVEFDKALNKLEEEEYYKVPDVVRDLFPQFFAQANHYVGNSYLL